MASNIETRKLAIALLSQLSLTSPSHCLVWNCDGVSSAPETSTLPILKFPWLTMSSSKGEICPLRPPYTSSCWIFPLLSFCYELCATSDILSSHTAPTPGRKAAWQLTGTLRSFYGHLLHRSQCRVFSQVASTCELRHPRVRVERRLSARLPGPANK